MIRRKFLMKAKTGVRSGQEVVGRLVSEKLDGVRVFWDGGVTRGKYATVTEAGIPREARFFRKVD